MKHFWVLFNHNYFWITGLFFLINNVFGDENLITIEKLCDSRRDGIYGYKQCSNKFIYCINNVPTVAFCSEGTIFDEYSRECVHKSVAVYCHKNVNKKDEETAINNDDNKSNHASDPVLELDRMCAVDNFVFSDNCSSIFWKCSNGVAHSFKCPNGLLYNEKTGGCSFADEVDSCKKADNNDGSKNFRRMSSNVAKGSLGKQFSHDVMNFERYCDNKEVGVYSFSKCSSRYYICGKNSFNIARCPLSYMFNPKTRRCESSEEYKCTPDHREHTNEFLSDKFNCSGKVDGYYGFGGLYKDFYGCLKGEFFYYSCEKGLYFNPVSQYCEHIVKSKKTGEMESVAVSYRKKSKTEFDCSQVPNGLYSLGCSPIYFSCEPNHTVMKQCSLGNVFNQKTLACSTFSECQITIKEVEIDIVISGARCSDENEYKTFNCKPYYIYCCNGQQYLQYCAAGEIFDPQLGRCTSDHMCNIYDDRDESEVATTTNAVPHCIPNERSPVGECMIEYLECNKEGQFVKRACGNEEVFDHLKGFCRPSQDCSKPIETNRNEEGLCTPGKTKAIMSCHEFYFFCNEHGRQSILQCTKGTLFDMNFGYCRPEGVCGKLIDPKPSITTTTMGTTTHKLDECKAGEIMVVAECGVTYTECGMDKVFEIKVCPQGTAFDSRENKCVSLHRCGKVISETTTIKSVNETTSEEYEVMCTPGEIDIIYECSPNYLECNTNSQFTIRNCQGDYLFDGVRKECLPRNVCGKLVTSTAPTKLLCKRGNTYTDEDCSEKYFHCSSLGQYEAMKCSEGLVFDSSTKQCVQRSSCSRYTTTSSPITKCRVGEILIIDDCFPRYSKCNEYGEFQIMKCEKGYVFDKVKESCVDKELCGLEDTSLVTSTTQKTTEEDKFATCTPGSCEVIGECFQQFLQCNDLGKIRIKSCEKGYAFDTNHKKCVIEYLCGQFEVEETTTPSTTTLRTTSAVSEDQSSKCSPGSHEIIGECSQQFLQCGDLGKFEVRSCPEGFAFDPKYNNCVGVHVCGQKEVEETTTPSTTTTSTTTLGTTTVVSEDQSSRCSPGSYEVIDNCFQQFLQCSDSGKFEIKNCPEGFAFDSRYNGCVDVHVCGQEEVEETTTPSTTTLGTTTAVSEDHSSKCSPGAYEAIDECFQQFLQCSDSGKFEIKNCPEGFVFDLRYKGCIDAYVCGQKEVEETTTPSTTTTSEVPTTTVVEEDQSSRCIPGSYDVVNECFQQFLKCDKSGKFIIKSCLKGLVFDINHKKCVEKNVCGQYEGDVMTTSPTTTSRTPTTTVDEDLSNKCIPGTYEIIDECFQQFLQCNDLGSFEIRSCPEGFVFNPIHKGCIDEYVCGQKEVEDTTTVMTTTPAEDSSIRCNPGTYEMIDECSQQFLHCNDAGRIEVENCPAGFVFNLETKGCIDEYLCNNREFDDTTLVPITSTDSPIKQCKKGEVKEIGTCFPAFLFCDLSNNFIVRSCGYKKVFDEKNLVCVDADDCGVTTVPPTTTIKAPTCSLGDFMVTTNCVPSYFQCNAYNIFEMKVCNGNDVFDEIRETCVDQSVCGSSIHDTTDFPLEKCKMGLFVELDVCSEEYAHCDQSGEYVVKSCPNNYVFNGKSNSCILKEVCESQNIDTTTPTPTPNPTDECIVGSYREISPCSNGYIKCVEPGVYVYANCEQNFVFDRNTLSCATSKKCNGNDMGYGSGTVEGYSKPNWYATHKPTSFGPETDHVEDRFNYVNFNPHDAHSILNTYHTKEELESHPINDEFSRNTNIPLRYISPYDLDNDADDLNIYEPVFSQGKSLSGYPENYHDDEDFVLDDFIGDAAHTHYLEDRTNHFEGAKSDYIFDRFLDTQETPHHGLESYHSEHTPDYEHQYNLDGFLIPPEADVTDKDGVHHPHDPHYPHHPHYPHDPHYPHYPHDPHYPHHPHEYSDYNEHFGYEEPLYEAYSSDFNIRDYPKINYNARRKRSSPPKEENVKNEDSSNQVLDKAEYYFIFDYSAHSAKPLSAFCNNSVNNLASIGYCTEEFINCSNLNDIFIQRCDNRNVFDRKSGECVPYEVCVNSRSTYTTQSLDFNDDILDDNKCIQLGDGIYYKEGCGKYFIVCNNSRMAHMHCPRDMYFDINRFQCDYIENIDACKHTVFKEDEDRLTIPTPKFNCKNVPNGFIGAECSNVFAYCQNEIVKRKFRCPRNHVFDSNSRLCVLPEMIPACDNNPMFIDSRCASNPNRAFGYQCSSLIHHCLNGRHYTYPCGENRFLNNKTMQCLPINELKECEKLLTPRSIEIEDLENSCKVGGIKNVAIDTCNREYIKCLKTGQQLYVKCDVGLVFDEQVNSCVPLDECITKFSLNDKISETTKPPVYIEKNESLLIVVDPICEGKKGNELVATGMCKREYIECIKTTAVRRSCESDFVFSKSKNSCVYKFTSPECEFPKFDDQQFIDSNDIPPFDSIKFCIGKENRFYRNPQNCTIAIRCYEEQTHAMYTCARGLVYDEENQKCDYAQKFKRCVGSEEIEPVLNISSDVECTIANHGLFIPDASDCSKYYRCVWGTLVEKKCPLNTKFNAKFSVCDTPISPDSCEFH